MFATARSEEHAFLEALGVTRAIDYTKTDFTTQLENLDTVIDLVGGQYGPRSIDVLRQNGLLLTAAMDTGVTPASVAERGRRHGRVGIRPSGENLRHVTSMIEGGILRVHVQETFPSNRSQQLTP